MTVEAAAKAQAARIVDAKKANPTFNASANQMTGGQGTTALYLTTLWDDEAGAAPKSWIRTWFGTFSAFACWEFPSPRLGYIADNLCRV